VVQVVLLLVPPVLLPILLVVILLVLPVLMNVLVVPPEIQFATSRPSSEKVRW
jgi:hypothetical protein